MLATYLHDHLAGATYALDLVQLRIFGFRHSRQARNWRALAEISGDEPTLTNVDFASLIARAENQERLVEEQRLVASHRSLDSSLRE